RYALGLLEVDFSPAVQDASLVPVPYELAPLSSTTLVGEVTVDPLASSQQISLTNRAGAIIANIREAVVAGRQLWLHLDEAAGATTFADASLLGHDGTCSGTGCPASGVGGTLLRAADFDGDDRVTSGTDMSEESATVSLWLQTACDDCGLFSAIKSGTAQRDRTITLDNGNLCARLGRATQEVLCTSGVDYANNAWHHVAYTYGGALGGQRIYVDGEQRAVGTLTSSDFPQQNAVWIGYAADAGTPYFDGLVDEVEIYGRVLSAGEVADRFRQPVLHLTFDAASPSRFRDVSSHGHGITFGPERPDAGEVGVIGRAAGFDGDAFFWIDPADDSLNLRRGNGQFTLAAWIYPEGTSMRWRGVVGPDDHDFPDRSYPTLFVNTGLRQVKAAFGNGSQLCEVTSVGSPLKRDTWQHVLAVFDGTNFELYVNGKRVGTDANCADTKPYGDDALTVGRAGSAATAMFDRVVVVNEGDGSGSAEYNGFVDGTRVWADTDVDEGTIDLNVGYTVYGDLAHSVMLTELDKTIEEPARGDDDLLVFRTFEPHDVGSYSQSYDEDGEGTLYWSVSNAYFQGDIDDLRLYRFAFDTDEIKDLYQSAVRILELRLDEPPGAATFSDHSGNGEAGICDGDACPITGIAGRSNQAVWMDGLDDRILVDVDVPDTDYAVSFWFRTKSYGDLCRNCGLFTVADDDGQDSMVYLDGGRLCAKVGAEEICGTADIADSGWHHVVHTLGADVTGQHLYVDGTLAASGSTTLADFTGQTQLVLGQAGAAAQSSFEGALDDVVLVREALDGAGARALGRELPWANLHLDDPLGATSFGNDANAAYDGTCRVDASAGFDGCPKAGTDGWIRGAVSFDGIDDRIGLNRAVLPASNFSMALWVKPAQQSPYTQTLVTSESYGASLPHLGLLIDPNSTTLRYVDCQRELASAPNALLEDQWNHIVVTFNADGLVLYINGAQDRALEGPLSGCGSASPVYLGGDSLTGWGSRALPFAGMMDEFSIYGRVLSRREVEALYEYLVSWVDVSDEHRIIVDADKPTASIVLPSPVVDMSPGRVIYIRAYDETTRVESVRYRINGGAWQAATQNGAAWLFNFSPSAEGRTTIDAQAFDSVGSRSTTASVAFD
ncbi:MAG: LamG domain-containing protein, partial [Anaerolineae bacterium]|nr:LamG domain-containing protein [Anaerolineae bacterium]